MTAIVIIRQTRGIHLLADGQAYSPHGEVLYPSSKLWPLPHLPAIVAIRGPMLLGPILASVLGSVVQTYDALKAASISILRACLPQIKAMLRDNAEPEAFELVVAGISQAFGPDYFFITTREQTATLAPWTVHHLGDLAVMSLSDAAEVEIRAAFDGRSIDDLDPSVDGVRIMEMQRANWPGGADTLPDGFVQIASLDAAHGAISTRIVHHWGEQS